MPLSDTLRKKLKSALPDHSFADEAIDNLLDDRTPGKRLQDQLGLGKFENVVIQKVINFSIPTFIITVDSRRPSVFISRSKLKKSLTSQLKTASFKAMHPQITKFTMTPPVRLDTFGGRMSSRSIIMVRDLVGDYFVDRNMYESIRGRLIKL